MTRRLLPSFSLAALPALLLSLMLAACGGGADEPEPVPPEVLAVVAEDPGVAREKLARAVDEVFTREGIGETRAVIVMHNGKIAAERYAEGYGPETKFLGWSMSKTVTGVLTGMLVSEGRLDLDHSPPIERWQRPGDPRGEITLRQLLQMRSGLRHEEQADPVYTSDEVRMMFLDGRDDMAGWAESQPLEHEPGRVFDYSTASAVILADTAARVLAPEGSPEERREAVQDFIDSRLKVPLGMASLTPEYDRAGTMIGGAMIWANARDWAKFGEFLRHGGSVKGAQIVPRRWIDFMKRPSPRAPDYGAMLWLNRDSETDRQILAPDDMPEDVFAAVGHLGQYIVVSPKRNLTVVRLGKTDQADRPALVEALADVVEVYRR